MTSEDWIDHVKSKVEDHYWKNDGLYEEHASEVVGESDVEDSSESEFESDSSSDSDLD